jgi:hypothetical protein
MEVVALNRQKTAALLLTGLALGFIGSFTLTPHPEQAEMVAGISPWCILGCDDLAPLDIALNILLFVPLGIALSLWVSRFKSLVIAAGVSVLIELAQLHLIVGRDASLRDVITNTTGAALGIVLVASWRRVVLPNPETALRLAVLAGVAWFLGMNATGRAMESSFPETVWFGQWNPELGQFDTFPGRVLDAHLNEAFLPGGVLPQSRELRALLASDDYRLDVTAVMGEATSREAPIFSVFDAEQREMLVLSQSGSSLHYRTRSRVGEAGFHTPGVRLDAIPDGAPGDTVRFEVVRSGPRMLLRAATGNQVASATRALTVGGAWAFFLPYEYAFGWETPFLSALWLGGLLFLVGYWGAKTERRNRAAVALAVLVVVGLAPVSAYWGLALPSLWEWIGAAAGTFAGWRAGVATRSP